MTSLPARHCFLGVVSAEKLRAKSKNAAGLCAGQGIGNFCIAGSASERVIGQKDSSPQRFRICA